MNRETLMRLAVVRKSRTFHVEEPYLARIPVNVKTAPILRMLREGKISEWIADDLMDYLDQLPHNHMLINLVHNIFKSD